jgi:hypothetical protein
MSFGGLMRDRSFRRLLLVVLWLAAADQLVPRTLERLERARYESGPVFRFENSDLFSLGPLVSYLREHPRGDRPRTMFFGNSVIWGYGLDAASTLPSHYQRLAPGEKVFNIAINGFQTGSSYLISKAIIGSIDRLFILRQGEAADPLLPRLIPVEHSDMVAFKLPEPDSMERALVLLAERWRLYALTYRIQSALFGSSTRQYIYLHKGDFARRLFARERAETPGVPDPVIEIRLTAPRSADLPSPERLRGLRARYPLLCNFGDLIVLHRKQGVFLQIDGYSEAISQDDVGAFNAAFAPYAMIAVFRTPDAATYDRMHLTSAGAVAVAKALLADDAPWARRP